MTQRSRPQPESTVTAATYLDSGPYSGDQWGQRCALSAVGDEDTTTERTQLRGVVPTVWDKLCVTNPAAKLMEVDQGAAWVRGHLFVHDAAGAAVPLQFNPTTPANDRIDRVVVVENNTNVAYNTNLEFPTNLVDYNAAASVPAYCCRLAILTGVVGGAMRALVQTGNYWMIELSRYTISNAGIITVGPDDQREFAQIEHVVGVHSDDDDTMEDALIIGTEVDDAAGSANNFGVAVMARLEDSIGTMRDVARLAVRYTSNVLATLTSRFELWLIRGTTDVLAGVVVATNTVVGYVNGNARGGGAVDWQGFRNAATEVASGDFSVVSGGAENTASANYSTVGGGDDNTTSAVHSTVGGGDTNAASAAHATIGGGDSNAASGAHCTVSGGDTNTAGVAAFATIGGGQANQATAILSTIGGGDSNTASGDDSTIGGGEAHTASGAHSTIGGGDTNTAGAAWYTTVGGGTNNQATGTASTVGGGDANLAGALTHATVGGGFSNLASGQYSTVGGGDDSTASGTASVVGGGDTNAASGDWATVSGGFSQNASGDYATIGGGDDNSATDDHSTVGGGEINAASGEFSVIPGGSRAIADKYGQCAHASGRFALAGDAQGTIQMVARRAVASHVDTTWYTLYLDGGAVPERMTIAASTAWSVHVLIVGITANAAQQFGYELIGLIERDNANNTTLAAAATVRVLFESDANYDAQLAADDVNEALEVQVRRNGGADYDIRWTATVRTTEVSYP